MTALLRKRAVREAVEDAVRACHARIVHDVRAHLAPLLKRGDFEAAMAVHGAGAGDVTYRADAVAERAVEELAERLGRIAPVEVRCEGPGALRAGAGDPQLCVLVDPIDGTRNWMADLRSAWVLTGVAEFGDGEPTLRNIEYALQTEIPPSDRMTSAQYEARRGGGARIRKIQISGHAARPSPWRAVRRAGSVDVRGGYYAFLRYLPKERAAIAEMEVDFFERARRKLGLDPSRVYDDQWLCDAGQLVSVLLGRMRMFADVRAWLAAQAGVETIAAHPYDLSTILIAEEAGACVLEPSADAEWPPLDAPMDLVTPMSLAAFPDRRTRDLLQPILRETLRRAGPAAARRMKL